MKSSFFLNQENVKVKHIESYNQIKNTNLTYFFFQTLYEMNLNISLQWLIILQSINI